MKIFNDIELIDLTVYVDNTLILTDFHIGYEEALNKQGVLLPRFQFKEIIKRLDKIFAKLRKVEKIVILGDLKHEFGRISDQEWRHTLMLLDYLGKRCNEIILLKGNHDTILGPIAEKRNVKVLDYYKIETIKNKTIKKSPILNKINKKISLNNKSLKNINKKSIIKNSFKIIKNNKILCLHGDKIPNKDMLKDVSTIIMGHEHPAVSIKDGPRAETFKCFLLGKWKRKNLIVLPSFNLVTEGTDILKEKLLSPLLKNNVRKMKAVVVADKLYDFSTIKNL